MIPGIIALYSVALSYILLGKDDRETALKL